MLIDGTPADCIPVSDRGVQYGDGLFETIAWIDGAPCLWREHMGRLAAGAAQLGIAFPGADILLAEASVVAAGRSRATVKIIVTRGSSGRGYRTPSLPQSRRILSVYPWPDYEESVSCGGIAAIWCKTAIGINPDLAGLKHLNRLEQVLARSEWREPDIAEGVMCDPDGWVISGTMSNLFLVSGGLLVTPSLDRCGVAGVVRRLVMKEARAQGFHVRETRLKPSDLASFDGAFVTNSLLGVRPLARLGERSFSVGAIPQEFVSAVNRRAFSGDPSLRAGRT